LNLVEFGRPLIGPSLDEDTIHYRFLEGDTNWFHWIQCTIHIHVHPLKLAVSLASELMIAVSLPELLESPEFLEFPE
jgi:hypothetical protein